MGSAEKRLTRFKEPESITQRDQNQEPKPNYTHHHILKTPMRNRSRKRIYNPKNSISINLYKPENEIVEESPDAEDDEESDYNLVSKTSRLEGFGGGSPMKKSSLISSVRNQMELPKKSVDLGYNKNKSPKIKIKEQIDIIEPSRRTMREVDGMDNGPTPIKANIFSESKRKRRKRDGGSTNRARLGDEMTSSRNLGDESGISSGFKSTMKYSKPTPVSKFQKTRKRIQNLNLFQNMNEIEPEEQATSANGKIKDYKLIASFTLIFFRVFSNWVKLVENLIFLLLDVLTLRLVVSKNFRPNEYKQIRQASDKMSKEDIMGSESGFPNHKVYTHTNKPRNMKMRRSTIGTAVEKPPQGTNNPHRQRRSKQPTRKSSPQKLAFEDLEDIKEEELDDALEPKASETNIGTRPRRKAEYSASGSQGSRNRFSRQGSSQKKNMRASRSRTKSRGSYVIEGEGDNGDNDLGFQTYHFTNDGKMVRSRSRRDAQDSDYSRLKQFERRDLSENSKPQKKMKKSYLGRSISRRSSIKNSVVSNDGKSSGKGGKNHPKFTLY